MEHAKWHPNCPWLRVNALALPVPVAVGPLALVGGAARVDERPDLAAPGPWSHSAGARCNSSAILHGKYTKRRMNGSTARGYPDPVLAVAGRALAVAVRGGPQNEASRRQAQRPRERHA